MNNREAMQAKYEELCEKGLSNSFEIFQAAYQLGQDAALASQEARDKYRLMACALDS